MSKIKWVTSFDVNEYPDTDDEPIAENTLQYDWITKIKHYMDIVFRDDPNVFVAADLFWYPVEGDNTIRRAPDGMVAFGRPQGPRLAYLQWLERGIAPQVVFEVLSPSNRGEELVRKFQFYETYGVEEYYIYDPDFVTLKGWLRTGGTLRAVPTMNGWRSPRLGLRFELAHDRFHLYRPDGQPVLTPQEWDERIEEFRRQADEHQRHCDRMRAQLRTLGIEPEV